MKPELSTALSDVSGVPARMGATNEKRPSGGAGNTVAHSASPLNELAKEFGMTATHHPTPIRPVATADVAALDAAYRERMADCDCPLCDVPRIGDLLPDVLAEMRRIQREAAL